MGRVKGWINDFFSINMSSLKKINKKIKKTLISGSLQTFNLLQAVVRQRRFKDVGWGACVAALKENTVGFFCFLSLCQQSRSPSDFCLSARSQNSCRYQGLFSSRMFFAVVQYEQRL